MVCDPKFIITNCVATWLGSCHDARIFRESKLCQNFENGVHDGFLLGDSGYPCRQYLMTPYHNTGDLRHNERFSYSLCRTRVLIEQTFGILKRRFPCLSTGLRTNPTKACTSDTRRLLDVRSITDLKGSTLCNVLPALHALAGCDTTSAFVRRGKVLPIKLLKTHHEYVDDFSKMGVSDKLDTGMLKSLESFVCHVYGHVTNDANEASYQVFMTKFKPKGGQTMTSYDDIDMSLLPPCRDSRHMHIQRANYQTLIWVSADKHQPSVAHPVGNGWLKEGVNAIKCQWNKGNILLQELTDIISSKNLDLTGMEVLDEVDSLLGTIYEDLV